jgi:hypothetical protein
MIIFLVDFLCRMVELLETAVAVSVFKFVEFGTDFKILDFVPVIVYWYFSRN